MILICICNFIIFSIYVSQIILGIKDIVTGTQLDTHTCTVPNINIYMIICGVTGLIFIITKYISEKQINDVPDCTSQNCNINLGCINIPTLIVTIIHYAVLIWGGVLIYNFDITNCSRYIRNRILVFLFSQAIIYIIILLITTISWCVIYCKSKKARLQFNLNGSSYV
jgi:hypothetical protein